MAAHPLGLLEECLPEEREAAICLAPGVLRLSAMQPCKFTPADERSEPGQKNMSMTDRLALSGLPQASQGGPNLRCREPQNRPGQPHRQCLI